MILRLAARAALGFAIGVFMALSVVAAAAIAQVVSYYDVPKGDGPHDVAPARDGTVWYTGQRAGVLGSSRPEEQQGRTDQAWRRVGASRRNHWT